MVKKIFFSLYCFFSISFYNSVQSQTISDSIITASEPDIIADRANSTLEKYNSRSNDFVPEPPTREIKNVKYHVYVIDKNTQQPVKATIDIKTTNKDGSELHGRGKCTPTGEFVLNLAANSVLDVYVTFPNYIPKMHTVDLQDIGSVMDVDEITHTFEMQPLSVGAFIKLNHIEFEQGKFELLEESFAELNQILFLMKSNKSMQIEIAGHTDNTGSKQAMIRLSEQRVNSVKKYLTDKGIDQKRITGVGYGGAKPLVGNNNPESLRLNRRVEFKVIKI